MQDRLLEVVESVNTETTRQEIYQNVGSCLLSISKQTGKITINSVDEGLLAVCLLIGALQQVVRELF